MTELDLDCMSATSVIASAQQYGDNIWRDSQTAVDSRICDLESKVVYLETTLQNLIASLHKHNAIPREK